MSISMSNIYNQAMGFENYQKEIENSIERMDFCETSVVAEMKHSEEDLKFIELYGKVEDANTAAKIKMLEKINKNYGKCHRGIENYCRSCEAEVDGTSALKENTESKPAGEVSEKKKKWYKVVWEKIVAFFKKIVDFFKMIIQKIIGFFKKKEVGKVEEELNNASPDQQSKIDEQNKTKEIEIPDGKVIRPIDATIAQMQNDIINKVNYYHDAVEKLARANLKVFEKTNPGFFDEMKKQTNDANTSSVPPKEEKKKVKLSEIFGTTKTKDILNKIKTIPTHFSNVTHKIEETYKKVAKFGDKICDSANEKIMDWYTKAMKSLSEMGSECSRMMSDISFQIQFSLSTIKDNVNSVINLNRKWNADSQVANTKPTNRKGRTTAK